MPTDKINVLGFSLEKLQMLLADFKQPAFRAKQILQWIHQRGVTDFASMHNLPKKLMADLQEKAHISPPVITEKFQCKDGTVKWSIATSKQNTIEMVLIPNGNRFTLCVSSQAGCAVNCSFCATGKQGFSHNLSASEIIGQLWLVQHKHKHLIGNNEKITNVVFMGMGEPLLNEANLLESVSIMTHDLAYGLSKRKVTISTSGIIPAIDRLCGKTEVALAISLHAAVDELRTSLVPINQKYPIQELLNACKRYLASLSSKRFITFEYALIAGINDQIIHAKQLSKLLSQLPCKINLIPYNPNSWSDYKTPSIETVNNFAQVLLKHGFVVTVRKTRGNDIAAACGQLAGDIDAVGSVSSASSKEKISLKTMT